MNPTQLPTDGTLPLLVLQIIAVSGEFPAAFSGHFPGGCSYIESVIGKLKKDGLLRSYTKNGLRGLRLTASAKRLLLQKYPFDLAPYLTGASETNSLKSEPERRLRLHRMAEALLILHNAQIPSLPWEKPSIQDWLSNPTFPVYYSSREFKSLGSLCTKIRNSRMTGILFTEQAIFPIYNNGFDLSRMGVQCRDPAQGCLTDRILPQCTVRDRRHCIRQFSHADTCDPE